MSFIPLNKCCSTRIYTVKVFVSASAISFSTSNSPVNFSFIDYVNCVSYSWLLHLSKTLIWALLIGRIFSSSLIISSAYFLAAYFSLSLTLAYVIAFWIIATGTGAKEFLSTHIYAIIVATSFLMFSKFDPRSRSLT